MMRLQQGLSRHGHQARILCSRRKLDSPDSLAIPRSWMTRKIEGGLRRMLPRLGLNDLHAVSSFGISRLSAWREADLVDFHCLHGGFFNYLALPGLLRNKPAVMTLHDMWPLTGHCAFSLECDRWRTGCGRCPHPEIEPAIERDATRLEWWLKDRVYRMSEMTVVAPSRWLARIAGASMLGRFPVYRVPHGVDLETYRPRDREECRRELGIPSGRNVILVMSANWEARHKGADVLVPTLEKLPRSLRRRSVLMVLGKNGSDLTRAVPMEAMDLGYVEDEATKVRVYSAADVFVHPSRAESFGLVLLEAMACGTPAAAFRVGGVPDVVRDGVTGHLAHPGSTDELARGIERLLGDREALERVRASCRAIAESEHDLDVQVRRYIELYRRTLEGTAARDETDALMECKPAAGSTELAGMHR